MATLSRKRRLRDTCKLLVPPAAGHVDVQRTDSFCFQLETECSVASAACGAKYRAKLTPIRELPPPTRPSVTSSNSPGDNHVWLCLQLGAKRQGFFRASDFRRFVDLLLLLQVFVAKANNLSGGIKALWIRKIDLREFLDYNISNSHWGVVEWLNLWASQLGFNLRGDRRRRSSVLRFVANWQQIGHAAERFWQRSRRRSLWGSFRGGDRRGQFWLQWLLLACRKHPSSGIEPLFGGSNGRIGHWLPNTGDS